MASATARVTSLLICQCFTKSALKSFSVGPLAAAAVPARNDTASKPVNITFIGCSSKPYFFQLENGEDFTPDPGSRWHAHLPPDSVKHTHAPRNRLVTVPGQCRSRLESGGIC